VSEPHIHKAGDVWDVPLDPVRGREQGGFRPAIIVSADWFNQIPHGLCIIIPVTTRDRGVASHVRIEPLEAGLRTQSFAMCEQVRSISVLRLRRYRGSVSGDTLVSIRTMVDAFLSD
jgi:mRNA interferase MazF